VREARTLQEAEIKAPRQKARPCVCVLRSHVRSACACACARAWRCGAPAAVGSALALQRRAPARTARAAPLHHTQRGVVASSVFCAPALTRTRVLSCASSLRVCFSRSRTLRSWQTTACRSARHAHTHAHTQQRTHAFPTPPHHPRARTRCVFPCAHTPALPAPPSRPAQEFEDTIRRVRWNQSAWLKARPSSHTHMHSRAHARMQP
jgi:hypothetical protein